MRRKQSDKVKHFIQRISGNTFSLPITEVLRNWTYRHGRAIENNKKTHHLVLHILESFKLRRPPDQTPEPAWSTHTRLIASFVMDLDLPWPKHPSIHRRLECCAKAPKRTAQHSSSNRGSRVLKICNPEWRRQRWEEIKARHTIEQQQKKGRTHERWKNPSTARKSFLAGTGNEHRTRSDITSVSKGRSQWVLSAFQSIFR